MTPFVRSVFAGVSLLLLGCPSEVLEPTPAPRFQGQDPGQPAAADEAFAGVVRADEGGLFGGIGAEGQAGDLMIWNDQVQFVISDAGRRHGWVDVGGTIVDADRVRTDGTLGRDGLDDAFLAFGITRLFEADSVEVIDDGRDGGTARVRAVGGDVPWDLFARGIEAEAILLEDQHLAIVREFLLEPGSDTLQVRTTFTNEGTETVDLRPVDGFMISKEDFVPWFADRGLIDSAGGEHAAAGTLGKRNDGVVSLWAPDAPITTFPGAALVAVASLNLYQSADLLLAPGEAATHELRYTLGPDTASVEASRRQQQGEPLGTITGVVRDTAPVPGARVHFVNGDGAVAGFAVTDADGAFSARVPPGTWDLHVTARHLEERVILPPEGGRYGALAAEHLNEAHLAVLTGIGTATEIAFAGGRWTEAPTPVTVAAEDGVEVELTVPEAGQMRIEIADGGPATIEISHAGGTAPASAVPEELREALGLPGPSPRLARVWTSTGEAVVAVPPGIYDVTIGRSPRHDRASLSDVEVTASAPADVTATLTEVVARDGWWSVDTHLHAAPSMDGRLAMEDRLVACAAAGLDVPVTTDHDRFADYRPLATALGMDDLLTVIPGSEVTTIVRGHFNLFPVEVSDRGVRNAGALVWWDRDPTTTDELVGRVRATGRDDSLLQVNHGRLTLGMMNAAGYDEVLGEPSRASYWSWDFDATEIVTEDSLEDWKANRDDWFSFLRLGRRVAPTGASDSHDLRRACGLGRTDVYLDGEPTAAAVRDAIAAGRVVAASGVTLRASLAGEWPGAEVAGGTLQIDVSGPAWIRPATLHVWQDGVVIESVDLGGEPWSGSFEIEATVDGWVVVEVDGGDAQGHLWGGHPPYAITGAFLLDPDGDGWSPQ